MEPQEAEMSFIEVIPERLWIGGSPTRTELKEQKQLHGTDLVIMDLTGNPEEKSSCKELDIEYDDRTPRLEGDRRPVPLSRLKVVSAIIGDNIDSGRKVLLHSSKGTGRSPTCAAAYLIQSGMSVAEAKSTVSAKSNVWIGDEANYAGLLDEFGKIIEMTRQTF